MSPEVNVHVEGSNCSLAGVLDFQTSSTALDQLSPVIKKLPEVHIDLKSVSSANSAGLALLIECQALARQHQHKVRYSNIPAGLLQLAHVCEVDGLI